MRDFIQDGLTRGTKYLPMIQTVFRAEGLPLDLAYMPIIESGFKPNTLSRGKRQGPVAVHESDGSRNGLHHDWYIDERSDSGKGDGRGREVSRRRSTGYRRGPEPRARGLQRRPRPRPARDQAVRQGGFLGAVALSKYLPRETREYVPFILAAIIVAKNTVQYGFEIVAHDPISYDKVNVPSAIDLRRVAEWTGYVD